MAACSLWKEDLGGIFILEIGGTQSAEGLKLWGRAAGDKDQPRQSQLSEGLGVGAQLFTDLLP